jgi:hypothetical protein
MRRHPLGVANTEAPMSKVLMENCHANLRRAVHFCKARLGEKDTANSKTVETPN